MTCLNLGSELWVLKASSSPVRSTRSTGRGSRRWGPNTPQFIGKGWMKLGSKANASLLRAAQSVDSSSQEVSRELTDIEKYRLKLREQKEQFDAQNQKFWADLKERHVVYNMDRIEWGVGLSPIFTVHEDVDGKYCQVDVDENEILIRSGVDPKRIELADEPCRTLAEQRIERAKALASDIQSGLVIPSPWSTLYQYTREGISGIRLGGRMGSSYRTSPNSNSLVSYQFLNVLVAFVPIVLLGLGGKWILSRKKKSQDSVVSENDLRLMQARKLRAQSNREISQEDVYFNVNKDKDGSGAVRQGNDRQELQSSKEVSGDWTLTSHPHANDENFQKKLMGIQAMARKARLQEREDAESRSAHSLEGENLFEQAPNDWNSSLELETLAKDLDDVRRLGADAAERSDLLAKMVNISEKMPMPESGFSSVSQKIGLESDDLSTKQPGAVDSPDKSSLPTRSKTSPRPDGVKPRIILSADEARASIAAKKARLGANYKFSLKSDVEKIIFANSQARKDAREEESSASLDATDSKIPQDHTPVEQATPKVPIEMAVEHANAHESVDSGENSDFGGQSESSMSGAKVEKTWVNESSNVKMDEKIYEKTKSVVNGKEMKTESKDEVDEEMEWMRDDVLREIVFKVNDNEKAGREPFHNLNSDQETLFFKGLERKYAREGEEVKKWIQERVENIDYGSAGISVYDPPESYQLKWKDGVEKPPTSDAAQKFMKDRERILNERRGRKYTSPPGVQDPSPLKSSSGPPLSESPVTVPTPSENRTSKSRPKEELSGNVNSKTVISSSPRVDGTDNPKHASGPSTRFSKPENWEHTKKWSKELERKYAMETDPSVKSSMLDIGKDLERWVTEDELEEANRLLNQGEEGEAEYAKLHYLKMKEKIKRQREMFGGAAMLSKYSEYKPERKESELWWLGLPYVVCIGLRATVDGEHEAGLYSVDLNPALEGVPDLPTVPYHTVAFQDRGDALNFCSLISTQHTKLGAEAAELVPFQPKDLYENTKEEGFKVTVIKKGELRLSIDQSFEEVEDRIIELGSSSYIDNVLSEREIDMHAVLRDGLGFGQPPQ